MSSSRVYATAVGIGLIAGLRSMTAPAIVSRAAQGHGGALRSAHLSFLSAPAAANVTALLAAGEIIADKTPSIPARTEPGPLMGRVVAGGVCGAAVAAMRREEPLLGALLGALGAVAGTFAGYYLRKSIHEQLDIPDFAIALIEDTTAVGCGIALLA